MTGRINIKKGQRMKKNLWLGAGVLSLVIGVASMVQAGSACCSTAPKAAKMEAKVDAAKCALDKSMFSKLNLSSEQQAKVDALTAECATTECTVTAKKNMNEGMKKILSAEQYASFQAMCKDAGCGPDMMKDKSAKK